MDEKFNKRFVSFCNSLDALAEARKKTSFRFVCAKWNQCEIQYYI